MVSSLQTIPLFPLSAHILPGGRMPLRIFEQRYIRMVRDACDNGTGFGICMRNAKGDPAQYQHIYQIGTFVRVVDFDWLKEEMLGITVQGEFCFEIDSVETENDGLKIGQVKPVSLFERPDWNPQAKTMAKQLQEIFSQYADISALYDQPSFDDPQWVVSRWLELLPIQTDVKQSLLRQKYGNDVIRILSDIIR